MVNRGEYTKKMDIKGRGRTGIIRSPKSHMVIMLRERSQVEPPVPGQRRVKHPRDDKRIINPRIPL